MKGKFKIEIKGTLDSVLKKMFSHEDIILIEKKSIFGEGITEIISILTPLTIGFVSKAIIELIKSKQYKSVKISGSLSNGVKTIEIAGMSEEEIKKMLDSILAETKDKNE